LLLYAHTLTPRLRYITNWFAEQFLLEPLELTDSIERFRNETGPRISYSDQRISAGACWIQPASLLFESNIQEIEPEVHQHAQFPIFFCGAGDMGFDLFASSFYLLSRYEEYLPHPLDTYGRFPHQQSLAFRHGFLDRPLVDQWMVQLCVYLRSQFPALSIRPLHFEHLATYDIDESFAYRHKPIWRQAAGLFRDLMLFRFGWVVERIRVLRKRSPDPYDAFSFLQSLHADTSTRPICFLLMAEQRSEYDKNLPPDHPAQQELIRSLSNWSDLALHPSWRSASDFDLLEKEKKDLEGLVHRSILASRQHYIRFRLPQTYRNLMVAGFQADYSMGYGSINGFRASTARSFEWYDLERDQVTSLRVHPFCYMEANSYYEQRDTIEEAAQEWEKLEESVRGTGGTFITIWHNTQLGTQARFSGWRDRYARWLRALPD
jgi:hypothetical protein